MLGIFGFLGSILGYVLWAAYYVFQNFGIAIIVFTIIVKAVLLPFSVKQQKSMAGSSRLAKNQKELREKYGNNRQKLQEEMNKLYEKENVKPMGGCLTSIIPMIVILGIFYAVAYPLTNTLHLSEQSVNQALSFVNSIPGYNSGTTVSTYQQVTLLKVFPNIANTAEIQNIFSQAEIDKILHFASGFNLFGVVDLLVIPSSLGLFSPYILFPVFCFLSNVGSQFIMTRVNTQMQQQQGCMKFMLYALPLFSAWIAYSVPCAVAFYWIISSLLSLVQSIIIAKLFSPVKLTANAEARHVALMFENEAKVPYIYAPREIEKETNTKASKTSKNKKKK
ncbi:MAG: YidC/Oxa1 family membrane protein insertase [Ruminococcus sp.]|nr:YidC/Oxa1 family membrane protein insertase [Ruminococcus sp.]